VNMMDNGSTSHWQSVIPALEVTTTEVAGAYGPHFILIGPMFSIALL